MMDITVSPDDAGDLVSVSDASQTQSHATRVMHMSQTGESLGSSQMVELLKLGKSFLCLDVMIQMEHIEG